IFGSDASAPVKRVAIAEQRTHPSYTAEGKAFDFGMVRLAEAVPEFVPLTVSSAALDSSVVGKPIRHAGFGVSDEAAGTGRGTKRTATYPVTQLDPEIIWSGSATGQTCGGDSGGPGFLGDEVAAVVSDGPNCHDAGWDGRVDV